MSPRGRRIMWALLAAGLLGRIVVGALTYGSEFDVGAEARAAALVVDTPLDVYTTALSTTGPLPTWVYPPGLFPWLAAAHELSRATGIPFHALIGLPAMLADLGIAWLVQDHLRRQGAGERARVAAVALVALGPSFALISGFHHHFDSVSWLPAVAAVWLWAQRPPGRRALACGLLIGLGAACKTAPLVLLLALLPLCRDPREAAALVAGAVGVLLAVMAPWLIWNPEILEALKYVGVPGAGGVTLALDPAGAERTVMLADREFNAPAAWVLEHRFLFTGALAAGLSLLLWRTRPPAVAGAVLLLLGIYALATGFFFQYLIWGLPFLLMARHLRAVAAIQALALPPAVIFHLAPWESAAAVIVYATLMIALWLALLAGFVVLTRRALQSSQAARNAGASAWR